MRSICLLVIFGSLLLFSQAQDSVNVTSVPMWRKYTLEAVANGTGTCAAANGCWSVNGLYAADKAAGFTQTITLFTLPANSNLQQARYKTRAAFAGTATATCTFGITGTTTFITTTVYNLQTAVSDTNLGFHRSGLVPNNTAAAIDVTATITTTVNNIDQITTGSLLDVWVLWSRTV